MYRDIRSVNLVSAEVMMLLNIPESLHFRGKKVRIDASIATYGCSCLCYSTSSSQYMSAVARNYKKYL